jgi:hypothetical protein
MCQQIIGTDIAEHTARRLAERRAGRGDDVGFLYLFGHDVYLFNENVVRPLSLKIQMLTTMAYDYLLFICKPFKMHT